MTKFNKLKTFNILIFALVPLLLIAMVATVTLGAMTAGGYGQNTIQIGRIGTVTCTATTGSIYPGATQTIELTLKYTGVDNAQNINTVTIAPSDVLVKGIKVYAPSHNTDSTAWDVTGTLYDTGTNANAFLSNFTVNNGSTITLQKDVQQVVPVSFKVRDGMDAGASSSDSTPNNYLVYSATKIVITFSITVTASGNSFS